jgi:hypothetical protein
VGLNPSCVGFPEEDRLKRFPAARAMPADKDQRDQTLHLAALNAYFETHPYRRWFASFEPILNGLGVSYYSGRPNTALHTDLCSPIATEPTWSRLPKDRRSRLESHGVRLWHALMEVLCPHIILISIARRYLEAIRFPASGPPQVIWELMRARLYQVQGTLINIVPSTPSLLVFGQAARTPFGTVSETHKEEIGAAIKEWYDAAETRAVLRPVHPPGKGAST